MVALSGCAGATTDPSTGGLAGGLNGIVTGAYERRITEKQNELNDLEASERALLSRIDASHQTQTSLSLESVALRGRLERIEAKSRALDEQLVQARAALGDDAASLAALEKKRDELRERLMALLEREQRHAEMRQAIDSGAKKARSGSIPSKAEVRDHSSTAADAAEVKRIEKDQADLEAMVAAALQRGKLAKH